MDRIKLAAVLAAAILITGAVWYYAALLAASISRETALSAANSRNLAIIEVLKAEKVKTEAALAAESAARKATSDSLNKIRKDIQNAQTDPACLAADDRDRALAYGLRNLLASPPD